MGIIDLLKKSEMLVFWNRCRIHSRKPDFRRLILEGYKNANFLEFHTFGDEYQGQTVYLDDEQGHSMFFAELRVTLIKLYFADSRDLRLMCIGEKDICIMSWTG